MKMCRAFVLAATSPNLECSVEEQVGGFEVFIEAQ